MQKVAIVYASTHHGNTYRLVNAISEKYDVTQIDATVQIRVDLSQYELIGFASGIDFGKFYDIVEQFLIDNLPEHKKVFFLYTCAKTSLRFTESIRRAALDKQANILGEYGCRGYNTYGAWKVIGGMNKHHPNKKEIERAVEFFETLREHE